jgi:hypothetical protein
VFYQFVFISLSELEKHGVIGLRGGGLRLKVCRRPDGVADEVGVAGRRVVHRRSRRSHGVGWWSGEVSS